MKPPSFKLDEHFPKEACECLIEAGYDAVSVLEQNLGGSLDEEWSQVAKNEGRTLVTMDKGFGNPIAYPPNTYPGILLLRLKNQSKPNVLEVLQRVIPLFKQHSIQGGIWIVDETKIRFR